MSDTSISPFPTGGAAGTWSRAASDAVVAAAAIGTLLALEWRFGLYERLAARLPLTPLRLAELEAVLVMVSVTAAVLLLRRWRDEVRHSRRHAQVQAALRRSEALLAEAERIAGLGSWEYDVPSGRVWWSDGNFRLFGLRPGSLDPTYDDYLARVAPEDRERVHALVSQVMERGGGFQYVQRVVRDDGAVRHQQVRAEAFLDGRGRTVRMMGVVQDVTERHQADEALRQSEARLALALAGSEQGLWDWNVATGEVHFSARWLEMLGYAPGEVEPHVRAWEHLVHPDDLEDVMQVLQRHLRGETEAYETEHRLRTRDGGWKWVLDRGKVVERGPGGEPLRATGTHTDVTARREAELALEAVDAHLRRLVGTSPYGIYGLDAEGRFTQVNPAVEAITGRPAADLLGAHFALVLAVHEHERVGAAFHRVISGQVERLEADVTVVRADGQERRVRYTASAAWEGGRIVGVQGIARDVTEWHAMEEQLRQAQKLEAVGRLAGGIAHDFNNALMVIRGFSSLLAREVPHGSTAYAYLDEIRAAATRSADVTRQLLAFSRRQVLEPRPVSGRALLEGIAPRLSNLAGAGIELRVEVSEPDVRVLADPGQVEQVLAGLALNARDAMPRGGSLVLRARPLTVRGGDPDRFPEPVAAGEYLRIQVRDTGHGMDEDTLARAFDPFFTTRGPGRGTGLGLSSAYGIVRQSGGSMWAESQPGEGTCVTLLLPRAADDAERAA